MRNFKELKIWQKGIDIAIKAYQFVETLSQEDHRATNDKGTRLYFLKYCRRKQQV